MTHPNAANFRCQLADIRDDVKRIDAVNLSLVLQNYVLFVFSNSYNI